MARQQKLPRRLQPMLATLVDSPFDDKSWVFETKVFWLVGAGREERRALAVRRARGNGVRRRETQEHIHAFTATTDNQQAVS